MPTHNDLFDLWCSIGREKVVKIPEYQRPDAQLSQGYRSRVTTYAFKEE
jgi:hypothetical protein